MWWRLKRSVFDSQKGTKNKNALKKIVGGNLAPGILAYSNKEPVGWCAIAPREHYPVLNNSRVLAKVDDKPVWSITCFFIKKEFRKNNLSSELIKEAVKFATSHKAKIIEGYPQTKKNNNMPAAFVWTGFESAFARAGFKEIERRSENRPIMRYYI
jgi:hypothetical protein